MSNCARGARSAMVSMLLFTVRFAVLTESLKIKANLRVIEEVTRSDRKRKGQAVTFGRTVVGNYT